MVRPPTGSGRIELRIKPEEKNNAVLRAAAKVVRRPP
jgi:hypothetical protein